MITKIIKYDNDNIIVKRLDDDSLPDELIKINLEKDIIICHRNNDYIEVDNYYNILVKAGNTYEITNEIFKIPIKILTPLTIELSFSSTIPGKRVIDYYSDINYGYILNEFPIKNDIVITNVKNPKYKYYENITIFTQMYNKQMVLKKFPNGFIQHDYNLFRVLFYPIYNGLKTVLRPDIFIIYNEYIYTRLPDF